MPSLRESWKNNLGFRNVVNLGLVSMFTDMSTEMVLGVLPVFLVGELGLTRSALGLIEGSAEATSYVFRMFSGVISDRLNRRKLLVLVGYFLSTVVKPLFALSASGLQALTIRLFDRVGKGVRTAPRDALLSESVPREQIGRSFGLHRTLDQTGAIIGPAVAFILIPFIGLRGVFWVSFIPGLASVLILILFVKEAKASSSRSMGFVNDFRSVLTKQFTILLVIIGVFSIGAYNFSFILLKSSDLGVASAIIPLIYVTINITHTFTGIPIGILSDKFGEERVLILGYCFFAATSLISILAVNGWLYALIIALLYGIYQGVGETVQRAIIPKYSQLSPRATAYGVYYLAVGICLLAANLVAGSLWDMFGFQATFTYSLVTSIAAILSLAVFTLYKTK